MNGFLSSSARQVTQGECNAWHNASSNPGQVVGPCPLLFSATKFLEPTSVLTTGATINYTIRIENNTFNAITGITVSDTLPNNTTYVPGSATANPPIVDLTNFPNTTASFSLSSNSSVQITYAVTVGLVNSKDVLINTATIDSPALPQPLQATYVAIVDAIKTYLPLVFK
jgi:uncharacterized repeat protein (TIGR01451 family)